RHRQLEGDLVKFSQATRFTRQSMATTCSRHFAMWRLLSIVAVLAIAVGGLVVPVGSASAAVAGDVVISEFMFDPLSGVDGDEFLELTNRTASPVDLSGWSFKGITLVFPAG